MKKDISSQKGFSFIELVIVIAIIGIVTAIALPRLSEVRSNYRVVNAANNIKTDMLWARAQAVSNNNNYVITFGGNGPTFTNNTYAIYNDINNNFSNAGVEAVELVKTIVIPDIYKNIVFGYVAGIKKTDNSTNLVGDPVTFTSGGATCPRWVSFSPTGLPNSDGTIYIAPQEDLTSSKKTRMNALTIIKSGRIKIYNYKTGTWK